MAKRSRSKSMKFNMKKTPKALRKWMKHVRSVQKRNKTKSLKQVLKMAKRSYKKKASRKSRKSRRRKSCKKMSRKSCKRSLRCSWNRNRKSTRKHKPYCSKKRSGRKSRKSRKSRKHKKRGGNVEGEEEE